MKSILMHYKNPYNLINFNHFKKNLHFMVGSINYVEAIIVF